MAKLAPAVEEAAALRRRLRRLVAAVTAGGAGAVAFDEAAAVLAALREVEVGGRKGGGSGGSRRAAAGVEAGAAKARCGGGSTCAAAEAGARPEAEAPRAAEEVTVPVELLCPISSTGTRDMEPELKVKDGVGGDVDAGEIQVPFSQVHRVVSAAIGSRFWRLQEGDSSDDEDLILSEVANETKSEIRPIVPPDKVPLLSQGKGVQSPISSSFRRSLKIGGQGNTGQESSSKWPSNLLFDEAFAAGYSSSELRSVGLQPGRCKQSAGGGRPWQGPLPPPRRSPPMTVGDVVNQARRNQSTKQVDRAKVAAVMPDRAKVAAVLPDLMHIQISNDSAFLSDSLPCPASSGVDVNGSAPPTRGLQWMRRVFQHTWKRNRPSPKKFVGGWTGTIDGDRRSFAEVSRHHSTLQFGRGCAAGQSRISNLKSIAIGAGLEVAETQAEVKRESPAAVKGFVPMVDGGSDSLVAESGSVDVLAKDLETVESAGMHYRLATSAVNRGDVKGSGPFKIATVNSLVDAGQSDKLVNIRQSARIKTQMSGDEDSVQKAARRARVRNLELDPSKASNKFSFLSFSDEQVIQKVASIGISLGNNNAEVASSIQNIKDLELGRFKNHGFVDVEELVDENMDYNNISALNHLCNDLDDDLLEDEHSNFTLVVNKKRSKGKKVS